MTRTELILALAITLTGFVARFALLGELAVEHFDEGVYASNLWFPDDGFQYPDRFLYAPPLLPFLIEWPMMIFSHARWAPFLPSLLLGSLTVPLAWWSVRRWSCGAAGVAAAVLIALSDFHITMSRSVLTDVPLVFFLLLAVWLAIESLSKTDFKLAAAAGMATGLAWFTKYNGWLPLAIATSGGVAAWMLYSGARAENNEQEADHAPRFSSVAGCLAVMIIAAVVTWSPVWWDLQPVGGYARVAENHSQYVTGIAEWWPSAIRHEAVQRHYAGWPTLLSGWLAVVSAACVLRVERSTWNSPNHHNDSIVDTTDQGVKRSTWNETAHTPGDYGSRVSDAAVEGVERSTWNDSGFVTTVLITAALAGAVVLSPLAALGVWSLTELIATVLTLRKQQASRLSNPVRPKTKKKDRSKAGRKSDATPTDELATRLWFGAWLHLAWLCGLLLATPLYRPYPRLILPLMCVGSLVTGAAVVRLLNGRLVVPQPGDRKAALDIRNQGDGCSSIDTAQAEGNPTPESVVRESNTTRRLRARFIWLVPIAFLCVWRAMNSTSGAWQDRSALARIADEAVATAADDCKDEPPVNANVDFVVYVYGEPGLFFHIPQDSEPGEPVIPVRPVMDLSFAKPGTDHPRIPTYVLVGPHAWKSEHFGQQLREVQDSMRLVEVFPYRISDFVLLDDHPPELLTRHRKDDVRLFRVEFM